MTRKGVGGCHVVFSKSCGSSLQSLGRHWTHARALGSSPSCRAPVDHLPRRAVVLFLSAQLRYILDSLLTTQHQHLSQHPQTLHSQWFSTLKAMSSSVSIQSAQAPSGLFAHGYLRGISPDWGDVQDPHLRQGSLRMGDGQRNQIRSSSEEKVHNGLLFFTGVSGSCDASR